MTEYAGVLRDGDRNKSRYCDLDELPTRRVEAPQKPVYVLTSEFEEMYNSMSAAETRQRYATDAEFKSLVDQILRKQGHKDDEA